ncbi:MAG: hypothetical protein M1828_001772 [Chrysothrix sp. TS-e1954]|nr:MAG: hypothetical protein M1828_001772 [Chrysothrix sp. TS-e1954]
MASLIRSCRGRRRSGTSSSSLRSLEESNNSRDTTPNGSTVCELTSLRPPPANANPRNTYTTYAEPGNEFPYLTRRMLSTRLGSRTAAWHKLTGGRLPDDVPAQQPQSVFGFWRRSFWGGSKRQKRTDAEANMHKDTADFLRSQPAAPTASARDSPQRPAATAVVPEAITRPPPRATEPAPRHRVTVVSPHEYPPTDRHAPDYYREPRPEPVRELHYAEDYTTHDQRRRPQAAANVPANGTYTAWRRAIPPRGPDLCPAPVPTIPSGHFQHYADYPHNCECGDPQPHERSHGGECRKSLWEQPEEAESRHQPEETGSRRDRRRKPPRLPIEIVRRPSALWWVDEVEQRENMSEPWVTARDTLPQEPRPAVLKPVPHGKRRAVAQNSTATTQRHSNGEAPSTDSWPLRSRYYADAPSPISPLRQEERARSPVSPVSPRLDSMGRASATPELRDRRGRRVNPGR